jgi:hypothetical protein
MSIRRVGIFLALWSFGFACVHVAWALGWRAGVPESAPPILERPVFLTYDLVSGGLMFAAAWVSVSLMGEDMSQRVRDLLLRATLIGSLLALLRGVPALVWDGLSGARPGLGLFADVWFVVAGTAGLLLWHAVRTAAQKQEARAARTQPLPTRCTGFS